MQLEKRISKDSQTEISRYSRAKNRLLAKMISTQPGKQKQKQKFYYHHDGLGSVIALTDKNGSSITRYRYDAFGRLIEGDTGKNSYTFTGKRLDPESELYHFHFRKYDPTTGTWTTPDPIGILGGINLYRYLHNNPVNFRDLLGLCEDSISPNGKEIESSNLIEALVNEKTTISGSIFGISGEKPVLGRPGTDLIPGKGAALFIEKAGPFMHNFAVIHDSMVNALGFENDTVGDRFTNIPSMPIAYAAAVLATSMQATFELLEKSFEIAQSINGFLGEITDTFEGFLNDITDKVGGFMENVSETIGNFFGEESLNNQEEEQEADISGEGGLGYF